LIVTNNLINYPIKEAKSNPLDQISIISSKSSTANPLQILTDKHHNVAFIANTKNYAKDINKIKNELNHIGIKAYLQDKCNYKNLILAKSVRDAFLDIKKAGFYIPKGLSIHLDGSKDNFERGTYDMAYTEVTKDQKEKPVIYLNTQRYRAQKDIPYAFHSYGDKEIYNAKVDIYHEFAHYSQAVENRDLYRSLTREKFDEETRQEIAKCINSYAATSKAEFVAEYLAYKLAGIKVSNDKIDLEKLYDECKGPKPIYSDVLKNN